MFTLVLYISCQQLEDMCNLLGKSVGQSKNLMSLLGNGLIIFLKKGISNLFWPAFIFLYMVSNWLRCQIGPGVKLTLLHSWCQIGPVSNWCRCQIDSFTLLVSNWYRCQIDSFTLLVSNCPPHTLGVKLTPVSNWCRCQIVLQPGHFLDRTRKPTHFCTYKQFWP